ncbi:hypothetical protein [Neobacillus sp. D3-1R]|uniref:hypothetical protein n=1 Tax=Neobacillus sp. D3-1R TaxID=3445778 RepID=UPI003FA07982
MKIIDTIPFFIDNYHPTVSFLKTYYSEYPTIFSEYFSYHCKDTEERHQQSIAKYPDHFSSIKEVYKYIVPIIKEVVAEYERLYEITFPIEVNLIVGGFGSNAFTHRQIIPNITFALEKLSPVPDHLRTIVAHEFGHAAHNIISNDNGIDWNKIKWDNPLTWLYQEGAATHFSRRTAPGLEPSIYFSYNSEGKDWLTFAEKNIKEIKKSFAKDLLTETSLSIFREWFSINGGNKYGFSRLGYFLGDLFFQSQVRTRGEMDAIIAWGKCDFHKLVSKWLVQEAEQY